MYIKKITKKEIAKAIGMSKDHFSLLSTGVFRLDAIDVTYPSEDYNKALGQYIRHVKIGKFVTNIVSQEFLKSFGKVSSRHAELERLAKIGAFCENVINSDFINEIV